MQASASMPTTYPDQLDLPQVAGKRWQPFWTCCKASLPLLSATLQAGHFQQSLQPSHLCAESLAALLLSAPDLQQIAESLGVTVLALLLSQVPDHKS